MSRSELPPTIPGFSYVDFLGSGGYADVFGYEQRYPRRKVAVKVLRARGLTDTLRTQFTTEANAMAELADHPNIVPVFQADVSNDGRPYLVMRYYPRGLRIATEQLTVADVLRTGIQITSAVETAHRAGILHRDIKPANILVSSYGAPGLTDFGIASLASEEIDDDVGVSIPWSPPEVLNGQSNGSVRADVYSLAATLWDLLVGRSPFEIPGGDNSPQAMLARIGDTAPSGTRRPEVPASLERLLQQALAKQPRLRPASALEFARALQALEQEQRLPRTEIVVLDDAEAPSARPAPHALPSPQSTATVTRSGPIPLPPPDIAARPMTKPIPPPAVPRQVVPVGRDSAPPIDEGSGPGRTHQPADSSSRRAAIRRGPSRVQLLAVVGALVVLAVLVGVLLSAGGPTPAAGPQSGGASDSVTAAATGPAPGVPVVSGVRTDAATVRFTWTYDNPQDIDSFLWKGADGASHGVVHATVDIAATENVCIQVRVRRPGASAFQPFSAPACAG